GYLVGRKALFGPGGDFPLPDQTHVDLVEAIGSETGQTQGMGGPDAVGGIPGQRAALVEDAGHEDLARAGPTGGGSARRHPTAKSGEDRRVERGQGMGGGVHEGSSRWCRGWTANQAWQRASS